MDPPTEILQGESPTDDGDDTAVSMVLHNHDLLLDIMLRFDLHTSLARSIFVCKRWSFVASDPYLLRMFRRKHSPRLLGFYVSTSSTTTYLPLRPRFVPMPPEFYLPPPPPPPESDQPQPTESDQPPPPPTESDEPPPPESNQPPAPESDQPQPTESDEPPPPESDQQPTESDQPTSPEPDQPPPTEFDQPPPPEELAAAVRLVESYRGLDAYDEDLACISDLQNDTMLVSGLYGKGCPALEVHWPMSPHRGVVPVPVTPYDPLDDPAISAANFILKVDQGGRDSLVYVWLSMAFLDLAKGPGKYSVKYKAYVYVLQDDGQWRFRASATAVLPSPKSDSNPVLIGTKIYLEHKTSIAALDLKTSTFSTIPLPEGMEKYDYENMMLAAVNDDVGVFLVHLDEDLQLFMWLHIDHIGPGWVLIDVVSLPEMFETLGMTGWTDYGEPATLLQTKQTGDFLEFVFLKLGQCAFCFDTRRRVLRKVYEVTQVDQALERIHPFMMTWPPKFPKLKGDHLASPNRKAS